MTALLPTIASPKDLHALSEAQLIQLTQEMRDELVSVLSIRPAHFASNLGVVELCLALHLTFDFSKDRLIWDTGHQIYPHKLITGRYRRFDTIRQRGGLMGYPNPHESEFDFDAMFCGRFQLTAFRTGDETILDLLRPATLLAPSEAKPLTAS